MSNKTKECDRVTEILNDAFDKDWDVYSPEGIQASVGGNAS